jgi:hydrogenase maturation protease
MSYANIVNKEREQSSESVKTVSNTLVVGLGNPILGDDAVGWLVAEAVHTSCPWAEVICLSLGGLSLMERLVGYDRAIIVDAIQTHHGCVGEVYCLPLEEVPNRSAGHTTAAHDTSLQTALKLGRKMGAKLPSEVLVVAIESEPAFEFSEKLSPDIRAAIPEAIQIVEDLLDYKPAQFRDP